MFTLGKKQKARGIALIEEVAGRFTAMIDELDEGVADCQEERAIAAARLTDVSRIASRLRDGVQLQIEELHNLRTLLGA